MTNLQSLRDIAKHREPEMPPATPFQVDAPTPAKPDNPWEALGIGSVVLAATFDEKNSFAGWWEAVIVGTEPTGFSVRWRDYPDDPTVEPLTERPCRGYSYH